MLALSTEEIIKILLTFKDLLGVPVVQLQWLVDNSVLNHYREGDFIGKEGNQIDGPHFLIYGKIRLFRNQINEKRDMSLLELGAVFGYLPYSRSEISFFTAEAQSEVTVLSYNKTNIRLLIRYNFELTQALVHIMNDRVKNFTTLQQQNDKMAALGKLAAGLAHELNNPSAALISDASSLRVHLGMEPEKIMQFTALQLNADQSEAIYQEVKNILSYDLRASLSLRDRARKESRISQWFEENGVFDVFEMTETFGSFNIEIATLENFKKILKETKLEIVLKWVNDRLITEKIANNIQLAASRISDLITSVKIYTHMDRGMQLTSTDVHQGIINTLQILDYKIRKGKITVIENYEESLPLIYANPGELNQIWTNLIDNALDSMKANGVGRLVLSTELERDFVKIVLMDDGPGIPADIILNIFDPFFTTKEVGKGTGMGLETVRRIVHGHRGEIKVNSTPGHTIFEVCLPISQNKTP